MLGAEVDALDVASLGQVPEVQGVAVLVVQQLFRNDPVLDHGGSAPLAGDQGVLVEVPPGVVGQVLRPPIGFPGAHHVERVVVEHGDSPRAIVATGGSEARQVNPVRPAVQGMRPGVAGFRREFFGRHGSHQFRLPGVGMGVVDVDVRRAQPGQQKVAALQAIGVMSGVGERAAARVPTEVVQLVAAGGQIGPTDHPAEASRFRVGVDDGERVRLRAVAVERDDVGQALGGRGDGFARTAVEGGIELGWRTHHGSSTKRRDQPDSRMRSGASRQSG